ncbi:hypothetical protein P0082_09600 [Candidatus Haliotispira prima]|uniref:Outer membrane protein beta-barrel domain-containing protein n=1 Tax=Candidatus Haliotispira prima TaxID=3034016 RepID=A0ABY8MHC2_9SPIO|nr:hypothetical protein P0082_09600 [Candidatus Haliotispira prima]
MLVCLFIWLGSLGPALLRGEEQPFRRTLRNPYPDAPESEDFGRPERLPDTPEDRDPADPNRKIEPSGPVPPYPNYPESNLPSPPRPPRQQEYLYLNHLYFEPLATAVGGFFSFGWLGMIGSGKAFRFGLDIYNAGTNLSILSQGQGQNPAYQLTAILLRLGLHFFIETTQLKGLDVGLDLRSGLILAPNSGNAAIIQVSLEVPFAYRFVVSFYSGTGRQVLNLGFAPHFVLSLGSYLPTSGTVSSLRSTDNGFSEYLNNGNLFFEPNFTSEIDPIGLRIAVRFGFDISVVF